MKLSIIVPVYNMAADGKLEYCLNSLVNQTLQDIEIIAVDDASTDNSYEILKRYEEEYPGKLSESSFKKAFLRGLPSGVSGQRILPSSISFAIVLRSYLQPFAGQP